MISADILARIRNGVCAVGYLTVPLPDYLNYHSLPGKFSVVGTGFLVRENTVITCRHVLDDLVTEAKREGVPDSQLFVSFVVPRTNGTPGITVRQIRHHESLHAKELDIGFLSFRVVNPRHFQGIVPLEVQVNVAAAVSEEIASYGYPHGSTLLEKDDRVHRWGPVVQRGWISGVAPCETASSPEELLLDLRAAPGMSGAPVFRPEDGTLVGILAAGEQLDRTRDSLTTTAFAQPITESLLATWLAEYEMERDRAGENV